MVQDVGGRDMKLRPVKSGAPWRYVDVGGYYSGGLRFRHIQSPDYSGLFAFLGHGHPRRFPHQAPCPNVAFKNHNSSTATSTQNATKPRVNTRRGLSKLGQLSSALQRLPMASKMLPIALSRLSSASCTCRIFLVPEGEWHSARALGYHPPGQTLAQPLCSLQRR